MVVSLIATLLAVSDCPKGYVALDKGACLAAPKGRPRALVVYFHGMLPPKPPWAEAPELRKVALEAVRRNVAVLAMKGEQGMCAWADDVHSDFCWPCDMSMLALAGRFVERVRAALAALAFDVGPPVLAGFSNGGYFVTMIASEGLLDAKGYVVLHAGVLDGEKFDEKHWRPTLLVGAKQDAYQFPAMKHLADELERAKWSATFDVHDGKHEVSDTDAKAIIDFAERLTTGAP
jgi:predicted esterase